MYGINIPLINENIRYEADIICQNHGVVLTEPARHFLEFAAMALIQDPPRSNKSQYSTEQYGPGSPFWFEMGKRILDEALNDARIKREMETRREVSFPTLLRALSDTGYRQLLTMGFKD